MKRLENKIRKINVKIEDLKCDLFFQSLPDENKKDYYALMHAMKVFIDNLPQK